MKKDPNPIETRDLIRPGLRQQASAVGVITMVPDGQKHGMTATAMLSISAEPPALTVCINRTASLHAPVKVSGRFTWMARNGLTAMVGPICRTSAPAFLYPLSKFSIITATRS